LDDWDLDIDDVRRQAGLAAASKRNPPKLVHKLMFSMPPGTPPQKVLSAVRNFAREEFYGQHRYALVLHTDEPHPHVHLVIKAVSEQGVRLNIKKATLRHWRSQFASHLRLVGVPANATERAVRGDTRSPKKDGIYRATLRGASTQLREKVEAVASDILNAAQRADGGKRTLVETRKDVVTGWRAAITILNQSGHHALAEKARQFLRNMPATRTDREAIASDLRTARRVERDHEKPR
jgi:hypothetical protein